MTLNIQINSSEKIALTKNITTVLTLTGTLRDTSSIINPVIRIEGDISQVIKCNYLTIPEFGRSYFITNITSIRNGLYEISAHVDVLSTYANEIRANKGITRKQENRWNLYINDGTLMQYQNPQVITKAFPSGFNTMEFVLAVAGSSQAVNS